MQIADPIVRSYFLKCITLIVSSILLCACNSNYIEIISDTKTTKDKSSKSSKSNISKTQINIDELLIKKEIIKIVNISNIKKIAVLLPMTGKYSKIGKAVFEGIEIELNNNFKKDIPELVIYDTGDEKINLKGIYYEMLSRDFKYAIGPLRKDLIDKITNLNSKNITILTLNYSNNFKKLNTETYQFGLLPEDEAICISEKAIIDGNHKASIFYPNNKWGLRIAESFSLRFQELGGQIVDISKYERDDKEINTSIRSLLKIEESIKRKNRIQSVLKTKLQYKPYISSDLDMIFSIGTSKNMKTIKPQFNFNYAEDVPFYSTSHIYNGVINKKTNQDLNGIKFCDIPWLYNNKNSETKSKLYENSEKKDLLRFVAIGMDSIKIIHNMDQLKNNKNKFLLGDTGYLQLDEFNKIRRNLVIVKFKNGIAKNISF